MAALPSRLRPRWASLPTITIAAAVFLADQLSKEWVLRHLPMGIARPLLPGLLDLQHVRNTGAAFSLLSGNPLQLGLVSALVSAALLLWILLRPPQGPWLSLAVGLLLAGAAGNGLDRWRHGSVTDFLALVPVSFPVFNLADVAINLAVVAFLLDSLLPRSPAGSSRAAGDGASNEDHG